ncbi:enoyl-CoA hydratase/isomerase family protein [Chitinophaga sp. sic0106]|uniref:enoyl-CoA hydratase/isomerase family protein n=1 Tax=Chitinophaga sp. sic0106 TaxID=2854785 RepID=UPI001C475A97|nr:enoyl-CoA hydratase/isomerase family protein [Chitinophaga sp. sic0106]MBV7532326.1 enoyl-CoA hydratase/isomerase family protein [Chitinophaga sp. sic0106]
MKEPLRITEQLEGTPVRLIRHNPGYWQVTFDAPPLNLFGPELLTGLEEVVRRMQASPELRVIVFDSALQDFFIAHFDVARGGEIVSRRTISGILPVFDVAVALYESPVISIAAIRGRTRGVGIEFAAACDIRFASDNAIFGQFEVAVGTIPGGGSMEFLPLLVGRARALEIIIGGEDLDAGIAERYGLINRMITDDKLNEFVHNFALRISQFEQVITGKAKALVNERAPRPQLAHMNESRAAYIETANRPERKPVIEKLRNWGFQQDSDFEYNVGDYLNRIGENNNIH